MSSEATFWKNINGNVTLERGRLHCNIYTEYGGNDVTQSQLTVFHQLNSSICLASYSYSYID